MFFIEQLLTCYQFSDPKSPVQIIFNQLEELTPFFWTGRYIEISQEGGVLKLSERDVRFIKNPVLLNETREASLVKTIFIFGAIIFPFTPLSRSMHPISASVCYCMSFVSILFLVSKLISRIYFQNCVYN